MSVAITKEKLVILRGGESQIIVGKFFILGKAFLSLLEVTCAYWGDDRRELSLKEKIIAD